MALLGYTLLTSSPARGGGPPPVHPITFDDALQAARQAPASRSRIVSQQAAAMSVGAAGAWPATTVGTFTTLRSARLGVSAAVPLPILGTRYTHDASIAVAKTLRDVVVADAATQELDQLRQVSRAWLNVARAQAHAATSQLAAIRQQQLAEVADQRFNNGEVARVESVQADAARRLAITRAAADRAAIAAASAELASLLGWNPEITIEAHGELPAPHSLPSLAAIQAQRNTHPLVHTQAARVAVEAARTRLATANKWPRLALEAEASWFDPNTPSNDLRLGVVVELPFWGKSSQAVQAAQALKHVAQLEAVVAGHALDGATVAAYRRFEAARAQAATLQNEVVPAAREAAVLARAAYAEGSGGLVAVLEAERSLQEIESTATDARIDAAEAQVDVTWTYGALPQLGQP